jgi:TPR repeat protein
VSAYECRPADTADCKAQCDKGNAASCGWLGLSERSSDPAGAAQKLEKACDAGMAVACVALGELVEQGADRGKDPILAGKLYEKGCKGGEASGCERLGRVRLAARDSAGAAKFFEQACDGGSARACAEVARLLPDGQLAQAVTFYRRACEGGDVYSCTTLGALYEAGAPGVPRNALMAENTFRRACYRGDADGCAHFGRLVYTRNPSEAQNAFKQACIRQNKIACAALNVLYGEKHVIVAPPMRQDLSTSCMKGEARSCSIVGLLDVATNNPMGKASLAQACGRGDQFACAVQKKLK